jgi:hypothetical protein
MTTKNMAYDHPAYLARMQHGFGQNTAGASSAFAKFVAFTSLTLLSITGANITAGTSTQTQWNGTGTQVVINGDQFYGIHVITPGNVIGTLTTTLGTATHGPFALSTGTGTGTMVAGCWTQVALSGTATTGNTQAGAAATLGGVQMYPGDTFHILRGTDGTAVSAFALEYGVSPFANVTA